MINLNHPATLAPLYQHRVFQSTQKVESHGQIANELSDHDLLWRGDNVNTALFKAGIQQLQILMITYGAEVVVKPKLFDNFALVHMTLSGTAEIESDGQKVCIPEGKAALVAPKKDVRLWWQAGSEQLILKIPLSVFDSINAPQAAPMDIPSLFLLPEHAEPHWDVLVQSLLRVVGLQERTEGHAAWISHFEQGAAQFLWSQMSSTPLVLPSIAETEAKECADGLISKGKLERLDALEKFIQRRLCAPLALVDLAHAAGVSVRTLNALCHQHRGVAPMDLVRNMRLDAVRGRLQSRPDANITDTAFEFGFGHLGRFSAYYRERFGELPKETRVHLP